MTLEGLEQGAMAIDQKVDAQVARCLRASGDAALLRSELGELAGIANQRAEFAYCLFSLELARLGEPEAKAGFAEHVGILLAAHRDPDLTRYLLGENSELARRWQLFVPLLAEFDQSQKAAQPSAAGPSNEAVRPPTRPLRHGTAPPSPIAQAASAVATLNESTVPGLDAAIERCFASKGDASALQAGLEVLSAYPQSPRREFALCLFELVEVRLGIEDAKPAFAQRTELLLEAFRDRARAEELVGESAGLRALWDELLPYLEEFFEPPEEDYEVVEEAVESPEPKDVAADAQVAFKAGAPPRPPPPPNPTPAPGVIKERSYRRLSIPPPPAPPPSSVMPNLETQAFWARVEKELDLLPDENGQLSGRQTFDAHARDRREHLKALAGKLVEEFARSPEARALACLIELYLAAGQKDKTLFGKPNEKRRRAAQDALALLTNDPVAAGHAAVLFEADGPETVAAFAGVVEIVHHFLGFCAARKLDPLSSAAVQAFRP